jgi:sugar phosphate isomerase/epimerase
MQPDRRKFIQTAAAGSAALFLSSLKGVALSPQPSVPAQPGYELLILATDWGFSGNYEQFFARIKAEGYDGAEIWYPGEEKARNEMVAAAQKNGMALGILFGAGDKDPAKNLQDFKDTISAAATLKPIYINCHTARDFFSPARLKPFFDFTDQLSKQVQIPVYHETHRGRALYSAPITHTLIEQNPSLRITADLSHWCVVHESLLDDQPEAVRKALERTDHIHARIGHAEGPQVNDPRAPEWEAAVKAHFAWWDKVVERKKRNGERLTILTEFGPPDYMWTLPYTRQPVADQWAINVHMMQMLRKRYS